MMGNLARTDDYEEGIRATPWFSEFKAKYGEEPNLNTPDYDYRAAWAAGARPTVRDPGDQLLHWPSQFKGASHPNRFVNGVDTLTGDLQNAGYSDLGVPVGATQTADNTADYGRGDLRPFAMGALAQQRDYQPNYAGGHSIASLTGETTHGSRGFGLAPHYTYPSKLHGEYMGGLAEALPQELLWRDLAPKIAARNPSAAGEIWLTGLKGEPFGQQVDRQWQDAAAEYFRRNQEGAR